MQFTLFFFILGLPLWGKQCCEYLLAYGDEEYIIDDDTNEMKADKLLILDSLLIFQKAHKTYSRQKQEDKYVELEYFVFWTLETVAIESFVVALNTRVASYSFMADDASSIIVLPYLILANK